MAEIIYIPREACKPYIQGGGAENDALGIGYYQRLLCKDRAMNKFYRFGIQFLSRGTCAVGLVVLLLFVGLDRHEGMPVDC